MLNYFFYTSINSSNGIETGGFGNTGQKQSSWKTIVSEYARPKVSIKINDKRFSGLLNTRFNITIISKYLWPKSWAIQKISYQITEISQTKIQEVYRNIQIYPCEEPKGQPATLQPYVTNAPLNLIKKIYLCYGQTQIYIPHFS